VSIPTSVFIELAHQFLLHLKIVTNTNDVWKVIISRRTGSYTKGKKGLSNGFHMLIPELLVTPAVMTSFRDAVLADGYWFDLLKEFHVSNTPEEIIDKSVTSRRNGLILIGLNKPLTEGNSPCSAHYICYYDQWRNVWHGDVKPLPFGWQFESKKRNGEYKQLIEMCYRWVADHDYSKAEVPAPVSAPASPVAPVESHGKFNLPYFLEVLGNRDLGNEKWKQVVSFCRGVGVDKNIVCKLLNEHCKPPDLSENARLLRHYESSGPSQVGKGSIVRMLRNFELDFDDLKLFPRKVWRFHNQCQMFYTPGKVWKRSEIHDFFNDVYSTTWGDGQTQFIYREERQRQLGAEYYTSVRTVISGMPFSTRETDITLLLEPDKPTAAQLRGAMNKIVEQKIPRSNQELQMAALTRVKRAKELLDNGTPQQLVDFLGDDFEIPEPTETGLGYMFLKAKQRGQLKRFQAYTIEPYLREDTTPPKILNIFNGFEMARFACDPTNIKSTPFWQWLWIAWANRSEYKMQWLLSYFAQKLQYPARKVNKYLVAYCRIQGAGKTSCRHFTSAVYDKDKVVFCESVDDYMAPENSEFLGKMFCILDDVDRLTKAQSSALKAKVTSETFKYKQLYKDRITLPSYLDLISTSNSDKPAFVESDCRRTEIVVVNPELVNNKAFWVKFYASCKCTRNNGMWFQFLANYNIELDVTSKDCRFDSKALQVQKVHSMKLVHRFVVTYFEDVEFLEAPSKVPRFETNWFSKVKFFVIDGVNSLFIQKQRLFDSFQWWRKATGQTLNTKLSTFTDNLADIGLVQTRKMVDEHKLTGFVFRAPYVRNGLRAFYNLDSFKLHWCWVGNSEFQEYSTQKWRFRRWT